MTENEEKLKSLLVKVKEESEKTGWKLSIHKAKIMASSPITSGQIDGEKLERVTGLFSWSPKSLWPVTVALKLKYFNWRKAMTNLDSILKSRDITLLKKVCIVKAMVFPAFVCGYVIWTIRRPSTEDSCFQTVVLEKTFESPLNNKEIKPVNLKGNQPWIFFRRTDAEAEAPILWPPH